MSGDFDIQKVIVIGGGLAGAKTVEALRKQGFAGQLTLIAAENHVPYERPPLSKGYLMGSAGFDEAIVHPESWYEEHNIELRRGVRAVSLDAEAHTVALDDGTSISYDRLVLATGAQPRVLPGAEAPNIHSLRTVEDADAIRSTFGEGRRLVLIGGGWIGLEVAAAARSAGTDVTVLEGAPLPLLRVLGPDIAHVFADLHRSHGVDLRTSVKVAGVEIENGRATGVLIEGGTSVPADAIVVGIGASPVIELAEQAGLAVDNGVLVDEALRTSDPHIFAVGDIANHDHPILGHRIRIEHWANALNQPAAAAATLLGHETPYSELPYFYTDQYDLGSEYIGHASQDSRVLVRGSLESLEFVAFWVDDADGDAAAAPGTAVRIKAAMTVNIWDIIDEIKPLIAEKTVVDAGRLVDPTIPYSDVAL